MTAHAWRPSQYDPCACGQPKAKRALRCRACYDTAVWVRVLATAPQRFWERVQKTSTCWLWAATKSADGYGLFQVAGNKYAHRYAYEQTVGAIPNGLTLDHLCRVRHCVNPTHLDPVTLGENVLRSPITPSAVNARKTHCPLGHPYDTVRLVRGKPHRQCRPCVLRRKREAYRARVAA